MEKPPSGGFFFGNNPPKTGEKSVTVSKTAAMLTLSSG
jgi:hypothetical protein